MLEGPLVYLEIGVVHIFNNNVGSLWSISFVVMTKLCECIDLHPLNRDLVC